MKEVGKIEDNKATFLSVTVEVDITTGDISTDVHYSNRVIEKDKEEKLKETIGNFVEQLCQNVLGESEDK